MADTENKLVEGTEYSVVSLHNHWRASYKAPQVAIVEGRPQPPSVLDVEVTEPPVSAMGAGLKRTFHVALDPAKLNPGSVTYDSWPFHTATDASPDEAKIAGLVAQDYIARWKSRYGDPAAPPPAPAPPAPPSSPPVPFTPDPAARDFAQKLFIKAHNQNNVPDVNDDPDNKKFVFSFDNAREATDFKTKVNSSNKLIAETADNETGENAKDITISAEAIAKLTDSEKDAVLGQITPPVVPTPAPLPPAVAPAPQVAVTPAQDDAAKAAKPRAAVTEVRNTPAKPRSHPHRKRHGQRYHHRHVMGGEHAANIHRHDHAQDAAKPQDGNPYRDAIPGENVWVFDGIRGGHSEYRGQAPITTRDGTVLNPNGPYGHSTHHRSRIEAPLSDAAKTTRKPGPKTGYEPAS